MASPVDQVFHSALGLFVTIATMGCVVAWLVVRLGRSRPGIAIGSAVAAAFAVRVMAAGLISLTSVAQTLRGGDELIFLDRADRVTLTPFGSDQWTNALFTELHVFIFAVQHYILESPELTLRVGQAGISVIGLVFLAVAVYELAGPRASTIAMWVLALEPTNIFFSTLLHKEANMILAAGMVSFGGAVIWKKGRPTLLPLVALGCLIAVATRSYAGWFLIAAAAATVFHAGLQQRRESSLRSLALVAIVIVFATLAIPTVLGASSDTNLERLQRSQDANAANNRSNLSLEHVDFSTRGAIFTNLPQRITEVLLKPFPWQLQNISQQVGLVGTIVAYVTLILLASEVIRARGKLFARAGPLLYVGFFLLMAYSLAAGNAGTAFRYRAQLVALAICVIITLWSLRLQSKTSPDALSTPKATSPASPNKVLI